MKKTLIIIGVILLLVLVAIFSVDYVIANLIDKKVRHIQYELKDDIDFDYSKLSFSFFQKKITLKDFHFASLSDSLQNTDKIEVQLKKLILKFEGFEEVLLEGKLHLKEVILKNPNINYGLAKRLSKDAVLTDSLTTESNDQYGDLENATTNKLIKTLLIDEFKIENGEAHVFHVSKPDKKLIDIKSITINSKALFIDMNAKAVENILKSEKFEVEMKDLSSSEIENHDLNIDKLDYNAKTKSLEISSIYFHNKEKPKAFSVKQKFRSVWLDIKIDKLKMDLNPFHIYNKGLIYLKMIELDGLHAEIYNDVTLALKPDHQAMPPKMIREIPLPFKIDSILIKDSELKYLHKGKPDKPGVMDFDDVNISISNITNIDYVLDADPLMKMNVTAKVWGKGKLTNTMTIDLKNPRDFVYAKGKVTNMPLKAAERMLKPLYGVQISSGKLSLLSFDLVMNEDIGEGTMCFDYSDLKVDIKKADKEKNDGSEELKSHVLLNFIANGAVVSSNMPEGKHYKEKGYMIFDRTKNKPIFDLLWNCTQVGIMDIAINDLLYKSESNYQKKEKKQEKQEVKEQKKKRKK